MQVTPAFGGIRRIFRPSKPPVPEMPELVEQFKALSPEKQKTVLSRLGKMGNIWSGIAIVLAIASGYLIMEDRKLWVLQNLKLH